MCKLYPYNAFTRPGGPEPAAGRAALRARSSNVRVRRYGDRLDQWWVDGRHAPVGAFAAPGFADASTVDAFERPGAGRARRRPERERLERCRSTPGAVSRASRRAAEVREEGAEEGCAKGGEEDREEVGEEGRAPEGGEEVRAPEGRTEAREEELGAETRQEEGVVTQFKGTRLGAQAPGQEARAPLRR